MAVLETAVRLVVAPDLARPSRLEGPHDPCLTPFVPPLRGSSSAGCAVGSSEGIETRVGGGAVALGLTAGVPPLRGSSSAGCAVSPSEGIETRYLTAGQNGTPT
jgi:hypothetical protein